MRQVLPVFDNKVQMRLTTVPLNPEIEHYIIFISNVAQKPFALTEPCMTPLYPTEIMESNQGKWKPGNAIPDDKLDEEMKAKILSPKTTNDTLLKKVITAIIQKAGL